MQSEFEIVVFDPRYEADFARLNREWIEKFFFMEESDKRILADPKRWIIDTGGQIFFALEGELAVATIALVHAGDGHFEFSKMATAPSHQGRGIGEQLGRVAIAHARKIGATKLCLWTNSSLHNAIRLYQRLGFRHQALPASTEYARADVYMELDAEGLRS